MKKILTIIAGLFIVTNVYAVDVSRSIGNADAPVVLEEFSSMTCSHCAGLHKTVYPDLMKKYVKTGKVRVVFRNFPLDNVALATSMLALKLPKKSFFKFIEHAFFYQKDLNKTPLKTLQKWANQAGFSEREFKAIIEDSKMAEHIEADAKKADGQYNIEGTPTVVVNGVKVQGSSTKAIFSAIEKALKQ